MNELFRIGVHVFVAGLWQGVVLIAAVALALRLCSRVGPQLRFAVWAMTFIVPGFSVAGFWAAILGVIVLSVLSWLIHLVL